MISRKTTVSALALILASATAASAFPAVATNSVNVRSGPGTGYSVIDQLQEGESVNVVSSQGSWYQIDGGGWASANYLEEGGARRVVQRDYYGSPAFYYGSDPYYYDDAGFYFYFDGGRRHRVNRDWFNGRNVRWQGNHGYRGGNGGEQAYRGPRRGDGPNPNWANNGERRGGPGNAPSARPLESRAATNEAPPARNRFGGGQSERVSRGESRGNGGNRGDGNRGEGFGGQPRIIQGQ